VALITILDEGDYHTGHRLGLTPPDHMASKALQATLGKLWAWREAELAAIGPVDIHLLGGDLTEGDGKKGAMPLLETDMGNQADWAEECARRVKLKKGGSRFAVFGSDFHVVAATSVERGIAKALGCPIEDTIRLRIRGKRFNWRHFCGRSDIERGQPTQDAREITRELIQEVLDGSEAADIYGRHHVHYYSRADIGNRTAYTCPAWELPLPDKSVTYPRKLRAQYYHVGYTLIQIDDHGEVYIRPRWMRLVDYFPRRYLCPLD